MVGKRIRVLQAGNQAFGFNFMLGHLDYFKDKGYQIELSFDTGIDKIFVDKIAQEGYKIHHINFKPRAYKVSNFLKVLRDYYKLFRDEKFDVVVCHFPVVSIFIRIAAKLAGVKNIVYFQHALSFNDQSKQRTRIIMSIIEFIINRFFTDYLICINPEDKKILTKFHMVQKRKLFTLNSFGVNPQSFKKLNDEENRITLNEFDIPSDAVIVGTLCRMIKPKGIYVLLESAEELIKKYDNVYFLYIGSGPDLDGLKEEVKRRNLANKVFFTGYQIDIRKYLSVLDIFTLPTYYQEGMPGSILEAMAMEKAVIATDIKGCRNIISDGNNGLLVMPKDADDLKNKLEILINDENKRKTLSLNGRNSVLRKFSTDRIYKEHFEIIEEIINKPDNPVVRTLTNILLNETTDNKVFGN